MSTETSNYIEPLVPDYIEPIIAYRVWKTNFIRNRLQSFHVSYTWKPEPEPAECMSYSSTYSTSKPPHKKGEVYCGTGGACGFYSFKTLNDLVEYCEFYPPVLYTKPSPIVFGTVSIWGKILEYEAGYRAEYTRPQSIWLPSALSKIRREKLKEIAKMYTAKTTEMLGTIEKLLNMR